MFPGGVAVLSACFRNLDVDEMHISDYALREGALYDLVGRTRHEDPREASVAALGVRYAVDRPQGARVRDTALSAFDQVREAWRLAEPQRQLLAWAASLHEIGLAVSHNDYHRHGAYLAQHSAINGFSRAEQLILATLILGHRRKLTTEIFAGLPARLANTVMQTCVLLRLAVLLHRSRHADEPPRLRWQADGDNLRLTFPDHWLNRHPLTHEDLSREQDYLRRVGIVLQVA